MYINIDVTYKLYYTILYLTASWYALEVRRASRDGSKGKRDRGLVTKSAVAFRKLPSCFSDFRYIPEIISKNAPCLDFHTYGWMYEHICRW